MKTFMCVTLDEYELPVAVAESAVELARICGVKRNTIYTSMQHVKDGSSGKSRYICVEHEDITE